MGRTHSHHTRFQIPPCFPPHTHSHTPHPPHTLTHSSRTLRLTMKIIFFSACTTMLALYVHAASDRQIPGNADASSVNQAEGVPDTWTCEACSYHNPMAQRFCCAVCGHPDKAHALLAELNRLKPVLERLEAENAVLSVENAELKPKKSKPSSPDSSNSIGDPYDRRRLVGTPTSSFEIQTEYWECGADASHKNPRRKEWQFCGMCGQHRPLTVENPAGLQIEINRIKLEIARLAGQCDTMQTGPGHFATADSNGKLCHCGFQWIEGANAKLIKENAKLKESTSSWMSMCRMGSIRRRLATKPESVFPPLFEIQA